MTQSNITNEAKNKAKEFNYFSPNIFSCTISKETNSINFITIRYVGNDSIRGDVVFLLDSKKVLRISPYEKQYLKGLK
ncbi:hypothetical protein [Sulfurimonas sp.]|uniref:hypothetical protein n=1 Tax=Sulfurimonas sp. TaxID=2022749 RepID=UPI00356B5B64